VSGKVRHATPNTWHRGAVAVTPCHGPRLRALITACPALIAMGGAAVALSSAALTILLAAVRLGDAW